MTRFGTFTGVCCHALTVVWLVENIVLRMLKRGSKSSGLRNVSSVPLFIVLWFLLLILVDFCTLMMSNSLHRSNSFSWFDAHSQIRFRLELETVK